MSLAPLLEAHWIIQVHGFAAIAAFFLGLIQILGPKGTLPHRALGAVWVALMTAATISSIFINPAETPGLPLSQWFTAIHIFTLITAFGIVSGLYLVTREGPAKKRHSRPFIGIYIGGLVIAGAFAFLPGRIMHAVIFGAP